MGRGKPDERDMLLRSIEKVRAKAGRVHQELLGLQESASFDPRLPGLDERAASIESDTRSLSSEAEQLREHVRRLRGH